MSQANNKEEKLFQSLLEFLREYRGFDFTGYKPSSLKRRITKQMQTHQINSYADYRDYLEVHPEEFYSLFNTILINVTSFFRDQEAWQYLQQEVIPSILAEKAETSPFRVWSAGCASGEEAYTLAMILVEELGEEKFRQRVKIYATDIDEEALYHARQACYSQKDLEEVPEALQQRYFEQMGSEFFFRSDLRRAIIFGRHDLVQDAPISRLDLLVCRNTLMYFNSETQGRILNRFHFALNNSGILFLGKAEMLLTHANIFTPVNLQYRIFRPTFKPNRQNRLLPFLPLGEEDDNSPNTFYLRLREAIFDSSIEARLIVDYNGNLVLANQAARSLFKINLLDLGRPLQDLEISYRPLELRSHIDEVYNTRSGVAIRNVVRSDPQQEKSQYLDIFIGLLEDSKGEVLGVSITFIDVTPYHELQEQLQRANQDLETTNEELQSSNEELETTNEELQSTNEELETTNEELQSTNEELETMNEELQSTNEELQTINDELRLRTTDLNRANAFLNSILLSLQTAVIVIDQQFHILTWNHEAENLWGLRAEEVEGQSLLSLDIGLPVGQLREPIRNCLAGADSRQEMVISAINRRGKSIQCRITYNPLKNYEQERRGVILLMEEVES